jgi:hypothetical protein
MDQILGILGAEAGEGLPVAGDARAAPPLEILRQERSGRQGEESIVLGTSWASAAVPATPKWITATFGRGTLSECPMTLQTSSI